MDSHCALECAPVMYGRRAPRVRYNPERTHSFNKARLYPTSERQRMALHHRARLEKLEEGQRKERARLQAGDGASAQVQESRRRRRNAQLRYLARLQRRGRRGWAEYGRKLSRRIRRQDEEWRREAEALAQQRRAEERARDRAARDRALRQEAWFNARVREERAREEARREAARLRQWWRREYKTWV